MHPNHRSDAPETICGTCGAALRPPTTIYAERACQTCGKLTYISLHAFRRNLHPTLQVKTGDRVVIPAGALTLSLDRLNSSGRFTRAGMAWFTSMLLFEGAPDTPDGLELFVNHYTETLFAVLSASEFLKDLDVNSRTGAQAAAERISSNDTMRYSAEYWALMMGNALGEMVEALEQSDGERAVWAMNRATSAHAMLVYKRSLEQHAWRGYLVLSIEEMLAIWAQNQDNSSEEFWQQTLGAHPLVLTQAFATPTIIMQGKAYVGGKGIGNKSGKVTDFLVSHELSENVSLVEIKTPVTPLLSKRRKAYREGVYSLSEELTGAIIQAQTQRNTLLTEYHSVLHNSDTLFQAFNPHALVIVGNRGAELAQPDKNRSFELFRQGLHDVQIVTFDELFSKINALRRMFQEA